MRPVIYGVTIGLWVVVIGIFYQAVHTHQLWSLAPIFADNRPQGVCGSSVAAALVMTALSYWLTTSLRHRQ